MKRMLLALALVVALAGCESSDADGGGQGSPSSFDPPVGGAVAAQQPSEPPPQTDFASVDEALGSLSTATNDGNRKQQIAAYNWLCRQGDGAVPKLTAAVNDANLHMEARRLACGALGRLGPAASPVLIEISRHDEPLLQLKAIETMPSIDPPQREIVQRLVALLDDSNEKVQLAAIRSLGSIGTPAGGAADKLTAMRNNSDLNDTVSREAGRTLKLVKPRRTIED
jgi:HEAT repeat protein